LQSALRSAQATNGGLVLDILGFDACSMASIEVAYQVMPYARYLVGSEIYVPDDGFEYTGPLSALAANPDMPTLEFANEILDHYSKYYLSLTGTPNWYELNESFTLSVVDLGLIDELVVSVGALATELQDNIGLWINHVALARNLTEAYSAAGTDDGIDIYHFAENLRNVIPNATIDALAEGVMAAIEASVLNETHGTNPDNCLVPVNHTHGLTMYFYPPNGTRDPTYPLQEMNFTNDTSWDELLELYESELALGNPTVMDFSPQASSVPLDADIVVTFSEPMNTSSLVPSFSIVPSVAGTFQVDPYNVTFSPDAGGLLPGTTYTVTISMNATDLQGHSLKQDFVWQFTTAAEIPEFPSGVLPTIMILALVLAISRRKRD
ncbi:MAG: Ig-like domain-containing protein, partial [Candidatus Thermoplasmatota archaeon]|nr:Ig-like domain-containing protein [Candidatus Thermoplasmatota archaeon]